jgi:hypothetical protein
MDTHMQDKEKQIKYFFFDGKPSLLGDFTLKNIQYF